jgi:preprotein translocase subunit SecG
VTDTTLLTFAIVIFALVSVAMCGLILFQQGAGAGAGASFGAGASATVFGARGSANFLTKATKWLAVVFFTLCLGLAIWASRGGATASPTGGSVVDALAPAPAAVESAVPALQEAAPAVESAVPALGEQEAGSVEAVEAAPASNDENVAPEASAEGDNGG